MHDQPDSPASINSTTDNDGASWRLGHSPAGGVSQPASAPGVAEAARRQGAPGEGAGSEGGPELDQRVASRRRVQAACPQ